MLKTLALTTCLGLILAAPLATPSLAETYTDPDAAWWGAFLDTLDGTAPDLESQALQDPEYLAADEFSRDEAMTRVMARLAADRATLDPASAEVVLSIRADFGDYDSVRGGFPVSIFTPTSRLPLPLGRSLFFRNWQEVALFPATRDEGRALRQKIGQDSLLARVDIRDIRKSRTRSGGYEGHVARVTYSTNTGSEIGQIIPPDAIATDPAAVLALVLRDPRRDLRVQPVEWIQPVVLLGLLGVYDGRRFRCACLFRPRHRHDHIRDHQPQHHWHQNARGDVEEPPQHQRQHDAQRDVQKGRWCGGRRGLCHDDPEALSLSG